MGVNGIPLYLDVNGIPLYQDVNGIPLYLGVNGIPLYMAVTSNFNHAWAAVAFLDHKVDHTFHLTIVQCIVRIVLKCSVCHTYSVIVGSW